ncbi:MAG: hypothetical protein M0Q92_12340 [Methanoregula sp.]|jgi:hypothetical protein|nr:hypothetical protein [Methanoregula sp.]
MTRSSGVRGRMGVACLSLLLLAGLVLGSACLINTPGAALDTSGGSQSLTTADTPGDASPAGPFTVAQETAYNQSVAEFWRFAITGPYRGQPAWTSAAVDPQPTVLYDINGLPQYYEFYVRNGDQVPGYMWVSADKRMGHGLFRFYEGGPNTNLTKIAGDAKILVRNRYPEYPVISVKTGLYSGGYPLLCTIVTMQNTTTLAQEVIIVDAYTNEIVPDHPSEDYAGHEYAWSYLDSMPESDWEAKAAEWEVQYSDASPVIGYALSQGIVIEDPLTIDHAQLIRDFLSPESAGIPVFETLPVETIAVTDTTIRDNTVSAGEARALAQAVFWKRAVDRPDIYGSLTYRNATLGSGDPLVIEDIHGRKLFYLFSVERDGEQIHWIVTRANRLIGEYLTMPAETGDLDNATRIAEDSVREKYPGEKIRSRQVVYCNDKAGSGTWVVLTTYDSGSDTTHRIAVDTWSLNATTKTVGPGQEEVGFPSLFSRVDPEDAPRWKEQWEEESASAREFTSYALSHGIRGDRVLTDDDVIVLGSWLADNTPRYSLPQELFNPLYLEAGSGTVLDKATLAWHEQADWFSAVSFDASYNDTEIEQIIRSHAIPYPYKLEIHRPSVVLQYYARIPVPEYNATFEVLKKNGNVMIPEKHMAMWEYVENVKRDNNEILVPVMMLFPVEANVKSLQRQGVDLRTANVAEINYYSPDTVNKTERVAVLSELITDSRVLFAMKEYPG